MFNKVCTFPSVQCPLLVRSCHQVVYHIIKPQLVSDSNATHAPFTHTDLGLKNPYFQYIFSNMESRVSSKGTDYCKEWYAKMCNGCMTFMNMHNIKIQVQILRPEDVCTLGKSLTQGNVVGEWFVHGFGVQPVQKYVVIGAHVRATKCGKGHMDKRLLTGEGTCLLDHHLSTS